MHLFHFLYPGPSPSSTSPRDPPSLRTMLICALFLFLTKITWSPSPLAVNAFSIPSLSVSSLRSSTARLRYGRNMEIWPPVGVNDAIQLQDSFPNGIVAPSSTAVSTSLWLWGIVPRFPSWWEQRVCAPLRPVDAASKSSWPFVWLTVGIWMATLRTGVVRPIDLLALVVPIGYFVLWQRQWIRSVVSLNEGPVPYTVQYPLGYQMTHSRVLRKWKRIGRLLDHVLPISLLLGAWMTRNTAESMARYSFCSWMIRVLFLSSSHAIIEHFSDRTKAGVRNIPLPIRGFIPVAQSSVRLVYLWQWMHTLYQPGALPFIQNTSASIINGSCLRALPAVHLMYSVAHLFGFLIPVALLRHMRVYFYMVEAQEVQLRPATNTLY